MRRHNLHSSLSPSASLPLQAAPFVGACYGDVPTAACTTQCAASLAPFNERCFHSVLNNPFFLIDPSGTLYSEQITAQFYAACFPPVSPPAPPLARPPPTPSSAQVRPAHAAAAAAAICLHSTAAGSAVLRPLCHAISL